jgi:hypothetical protein
MNASEQLTATQPRGWRWSLNDGVHRIVQRLRRMFKRRLRGESYRQWVERNLEHSEAGTCFDIAQCFIRYGPFVRW